MKELLKNYVRKEERLELRRLRLREFLQILILKSLQERGYFDKIAFVGGTALRFIFGIRRFSMDLDFIRTGVLAEESLEKTIRRELSLWGLDVELDSKLRKSVLSLSVKFPYLLKEIGLSPHPEENVVINLEIDVNPPSGWNIEVYLISREFIFPISSLDTSSLFSLKLHALFHRKYTKGRDYYDVVWFLSRKVKPNLILLNNALQQTGEFRKEVNEENMESFLMNWIMKVDFATLKKDVEVFLEDRGELSIFSKEVFTAVLKSYREQY